MPSVLAPVIPTQACANRRSSTPPAVLLRLFTCSLVHAFSRPPDDVPPEICIGLHVFDCAQLIGIFPHVATTSGAGARRPIATRPPKICWGGGGSRCRGVAGEVVTLGLVADCWSAGRRSCRRGMSGCPRGAAPPDLRVGCAGMGSQDREGGRLGVAHRGEVGVEGEGGSRTPVRVFAADQRCVRRQVGAGRWVYEVAGYSSSENSGPSGLPKGGQGAGG